MSVAYRAAFDQVTQLAGQRHRRDPLLTERGQAVAALESAQHRLTARHSELQRWLARLERYGAQTLRGRIARRAASGRARIEAVQQRVVQLQTEYTLACRVIEQAQLGLATIDTELSGLTWVELDFREAFLNKAHALVNESTASGQRIARLSQELMQVRAHACAIDEAIQAIQATFTLVDDAYFASRPTDEFFVGDEGHTRTTLHRIRRQTTNAIYSCRWLTAAIDRLSQWPTSHHTVDPLRSLALQLGPVQQYVKRVQSVGRARSTLRHARDLLRQCMQHLRDARTHVVAQHANTERGYIDAVAMG